MRSETARGRLTVLADNIVADREDSLGEHGFAVLVETERGSLLFDTGRGRALTHNAVVYRKDLKGLSAIILSHGHLDHTGGLPEVLRLHERVDVLAHPDVFLHRYRRTEDGAEVYNGIPYTRGYLERLGARFRLNEGPAEVERGMVLTGPVPRTNGFETGDMGNRYGRRDGQEVTDTIADDQSLIVRTERGLLVLLGCAHAGTVNIVEHVLRLTGEDRLFALVGGTHLDFCGEEQLDRTIRALQPFAPQRIVVGHCTGLAPAVRLREAFPAAFRFCRVGQTLEF